MFKKNAWVAGLLTALVIVLIGCVDALPTPDGEIVEVARLSEVIKDAPDGVLDDAAWNAIFDGTPFTKCGPSRFSIITEGGVKKLKIDKMINNWGEGLDVRHESGISDGKQVIKGCGYKVGDEITIKGSATPVGIYINTKGGSHKDSDNWISSEVDFDHTVTLTQDNITDIQTGSPKTLRLHYHSNSGDRKGVIIFEEIVVTGMRKAGDNADAPPPAVDDDDYVVGKVYTVPADEGSAFYMDLNACLSTSVQVGNSDAEKAGSLVDVPHNITTNNVAFTFTKNNQRIAIKFNEEQLLRIQDGGGVKVTITGTATVTGTSVSNSFRYHIGDIKADSNWNATQGNSGTAAGPNNTPPPDSTFATVAALSTQNFNGNYKTPKSIRHLILNYRGNSASNTTDKVTVTITKIKIEPIAAKIADLSAITAAKMPAPVGGKVATERVETDGFNGLVEWYPEPPKGRFALSTVYRAKVVITPNPGYSLPVATTEIGSPTISGGIAVFYNPETRTLTTANYPRTDSKYPPLPSGVFFKMTDWLVDTSAANAKPVGHNNNNLWDSRPIQYTDWSLRAKAVVDKTAKTITLPADARPAGYQGIDIYLTDGYFGNGACDPSIYKVEVTVKGKITAYDDSSASTKPSPTPTKYNFLVEESDGTYLKVIEKKDLTIPATEEAFTYTGEIPEKWNLSNKLRIHLSIPYLGFVLTEVSFENKGLR